MVIHFHSGDPWPIHFAVASSVATPIVFKSIVMVETTLYFVLMLLCLPEWCLDRSCLDMSMMPAGMVHIERGKQVVIVLHSDSNVAFRQGFVFWTGADWRTWDTARHVYSILLYILYSVFISLAVCPSLQGNKLVEWDSRAMKTPITIVMAPAFEGC